MKRGVITGIKSKYDMVCRRVSAYLTSHKDEMTQASLFLVGICILSAGLLADASAQSGGLVATYNDSRIADATNQILTYIEGSFGALVMVGAGISAILSAAFGQYKMALGCLIVAVGSFILRSVLSTFFNDTNIQD